LAKVRPEIVERLSAHPGEDVEVKFLHDTNRAFLGGEVFGLKFACAALAPAGQTVQQSAQIVRPIINEDVGIEGQPWVAVEDDGQPTYHREINAVSDEGGQQLFEVGSSLPRLGRRLHASAF